MERGERRDHEQQFMGEQPTAPEAAGGPILGRTIYVLSAAGEVDVPRIQDPLPKRLPSLDELGAHLQSKRDQALNMYLEQPTASNYNRADLATFRHELLDAWRGMLEQGLPIPPFDGQLRPRENPGFDANLRRIYREFAVDVAQILVGRLRDKTPPLEGPDPVSP